MQQGNVPLDLEIAFDCLRLIPNRATTIKEQVANAAREEGLAAIEEAMVARHLQEQERTAIDCE